MDDLFGNRSVRAAIDLQSHLHSLSDRISALTPCHPRDLLRGTLFGYYVSWQPTDVVRTVERAMIDGPAEGLHARLGIAAGQRLPPFPLRWCPRCYAEALKLPDRGHRLCKPWVKAARKAWLPMLPVAPTFRRTGLVVVV